MRALLLLLFLASAQAAPPAGLPAEGWPSVGSETALAGARLVVRGTEATLVEGDARRVLATRVEQVPVRAAAGDRFLLLHREGEDAFCAVLDAWERREGRWSRHRLVEEGCPDRVALDPEGRRVAFAAGFTGIAALYLVPFEGGAPTQLTNVGLEDLPPTPGRPPPGFVPPPHLGPPAFEGDFLTWTAPDGPHRLRLP